MWKAEFFFLEVPEAFGLLLFSSWNVLPLVKPLGWVANFTSGETSGKTFQEENTQVQDSMAGRNENLHRHKTCLVGVFICDQEKKLCDVCSNQSCYLLSIKELLELQRTCVPADWRQHKWTGLLLIFVFAKTAMKTQQVWI